MFLPSLDNTKYTYTNTEADSAGYTLSTACIVNILRQSNIADMFGDKHITYSDAHCLRLGKHYPD